MNRFSIIFSVLFVSLFCIRCQKELSYVGGPDNENSIPMPVTATIQGNILDENAAPVAGARITVGNDVVFTDTRGYFRILNASLDRNNALVTAEKEGYFKAFRSFKATTGTNHVVIKLIQKTMTGTVDGATGGQVILSNGATVVLPAHGIVRPDGSTYDDEIYVYAAYIDPTSSSIDQEVPGSFMANTQTDQRVTLSSYGIMAVELESPAGVPLKIKQGNTATLSLPIPSSLQNSAPATIPLWYVDENTGLWEEEGSASRNGNTYTGTVKHFTFWNCDIPVPAVTLSLTVRNNDNQPMVHTRVRIKATSSNPYFVSANGYTDSLGQVSGLIPANYTLIMEILDQCGNAIYTQNIGPFAQNTDLGVITLTSNVGSLVTIKGKLLNCTGNAVTNGYAVISVGTMVMYDAVDGGGNFSVAFTHCSLASINAMILGVDAGGQQQGNPANTLVVLPITDAGNITACGVTATQYINYTIDGVPFGYSSAADSFMAYIIPQGQIYTNLISASQIMTNGNIGFSFNTSAPSGPAGSYPMTTFSLDYDSLQVIQPTMVTVDSFASSVGQFYKGSFSGQFKDSTNITRNLNGTFRVRRTF